MTFPSPAVAMVAVLTSALLYADTAWLDEMDLSGMSTGWGEAQKNQSISHSPLRIAGVKFPRGVGTHAMSEMRVQLDGNADEFTAMVGVDDQAGNGAASLEFIVQGDGYELWRSGILRWKEPAKPCRVKLAGIKQLRLVVTDGADGIHFDHANWAQASLSYGGAPPKALIPRPVNEDYVILTPPAPPEPRLNGPKVYGVRPASPFLFRIPATGARPMSFQAENLPPGLSLDPATGLLTGTLTEIGSHETTLIARNLHGEARRPFRIVVGPTLALTPPMGWNSWYIHYDRISEETMRAAADQMVATGMADYGYQYVNIDDCWMRKSGSTDPGLGAPTRDPEGRLLPNARFPDIRGMVEYIHAKGLKAGIYISPGPVTCAGYEGSWGHEQRDAQTFADWGFDFLKYDWCSYGSKAAGKSLMDFKKPYLLMRGELQRQKRDIVLNLCQYGMAKVWEWGAEAGQCWRTTGDLGLARGSHLPGFYNIGLSNAQHAAYARPGAWNDPDYLLLGWVGDAHGMGEGKKTTLTPNEQYSYMSLWSLMAAPLVFSGDMEKLDPFTLNVLCNSEVIDLNQDSLGRQAAIHRQTLDEVVLVKPLEDGSLGIGLFNLDLLPARLHVSWEELGLRGPQRVRDVWRQQDIGEFADEFSTEIPRHGVALLRVWPKP